jgi:drug/metabolite transporter (DMT)-like permease
MFSVAKRTLPFLDAFALGSVRYAIGVALLVLLLAAVEGRRALAYDGRWLGATGAGLIGITGFNLFIWIGLLFTRPEHASIILALQTPLTALAVWVTRGQRPAGFTLSCVAVAILGVLVVVTRGEPARALAELASGGELLGDVLILMGGMAWVSYTLCAPAFRDWSPLRYTVLTCIPGAVGLVLAHAVAIGLGVAVVPSFGQIAAVGWQIVYLSVCTVVLGVLGFNAAVKRLGPLNTMLMLNLVPLGVFGIEAALGRSFAAVEIGGAALVIAALAANNLYLRGASTRR